MIRTQIQLEEAQFDLIRSEAAKKNISVAGLVREALARYLKSPRQVALRNLATLRPAFKAIPMDDLSDHDRWFAEAIMDSKRRSD